MRMNDQTPNAVTQLFAWLAAFASAVGITTLDVVYMISGWWTSLSLWLHCSQGVSPCKPASRHGKNFGTELELLGQVNHEPGAKA